MATKSSKTSVKSSKVNATAKTAKTAKSSKPQKVELQVIDYSEKAFAIIGDTKVIKVTLKELGGKYNPKLRCGAGWIFSKKKQDDVCKALKLS